MVYTLFILFALGFLLLFLRKPQSAKVAKLLVVIPFSVFIYHLFLLNQFHSEGAFLIEHKWIPLLNINLNLKVDGLSLLFSLLISGVGTLIYYYAAEYLKSTVYINRFFSYLTFFMAAMLGLVLSDNLISIFVFWELTSIASFFLIGYNNEDSSARKSAMTSFLITGLGGFFLLAGFLMIGNITSTYSIQELLTSSAVLQNSPQYVLILVFVFLGAFTKSAQFPFHFWLPQAMAAPTPVSAYLHSATMVKAGIYILARFTPILSDGNYWNYTLMTVGGITMIYGAFHSIFRTDMKAILAYTTISALGIIVFLLGIGTEYAIYAAVTFILAHSLYKAALFLTAGIVDHAVHSRDITQISGLRKVMPMVALAAFIAALSSAGIPLTLGFISKELIYESTLQMPHWTILITALAVLSNVFLACAGFMIGFKPFAGNISANHPPIEKPNYRLWFPVVLLSLFTLIFGLLPLLPGAGILQYAFQSITSKTSMMELKIWHGFTPVLLLSVLTIVSGLGLYLLHPHVQKGLKTIEKLNIISPQHLIEKLALGIQQFAFFYTRLMHNGYLRNYLIVIILFITGLVGYRFVTSVPYFVDIASISKFEIHELALFIIIVISIYFTITAKSKLTAIASIGIMGFAICLIFVIFGAPDLAMTQFSIDILTVVLFVLVLYKLPPYLPNKNKKIIRRDAVISLCFGTLIMFIAMESLMFPATKEISQFYSENAYILAKGKNVVNVILVDYRGFDTLIETIVLSSAAMGVYGLLKYSGSHEEAD